MPVTFRAVSLRRADEETTPGVHCFNEVAVKDKPSYGSIDFAARCGTSPLFEPPQTTLIELKRLLARWVAADGDLGRDEGVRGRPEHNQLQLALVQVAAGELVAVSNAALLAEGCDSSPCFATWPSARALWRRLCVFTLAAEAVDLHAQVLQLRLVLGLLLRALFALLDRFLVL